MTRPSSSKPPVSPKTRGPKKIRMEPSIILDAAQTVFAEEGMAGASVRAIARRAGCDPALLYYHFENKEQIFTALLERKFKVLVPRLQSVAQSRASTRQKLDQIIEALAEYVKDDAGFRAVVRGQIVQGAESVTPHLVDPLRQVHEALSDVFAQGLASGELRADLQAPIVAFLFAGTYLEIQDLVPALSPHMPHLPDQPMLPLAERMWLDLFWRGIANPEPPSRRPRS